MKVPGQNGEAIDWLKDIRRKDSRWPQRAALPGKVFFAMEPPRSPSRWNTLMALGVLNAYGGDRQDPRLCGGILYENTKSAPKRRKPIFSE